MHQLTTTGADRPCVCRRRHWHGVSAGAAEPRGRRVHGIRRGAGCDKQLRSYPRPAATVITPPACPLRAGAPPLVSSLATIALQVLSFLVASKLAAAVRKTVGASCAAAGAKFRAQWRGALFIPVCAALVGWVTNWIAVQMIFYPIHFWGIPIKQWILARAAPPAPGRRASQPRPQAPGRRSQP